MATKQDVDRLVEAYQATLGEARRRWGTGAEAKLTLAIVAENAMQSRKRLALEVVGGDRDLLRLTEFVEEAVDADLVGRTVQAAKSRMLSASGDVVRWFWKVLATKTLPLAVVTTLAYLATASGWVEDQGEAAGIFAATLILLGIAFVVRFPHIAVRAVQFAPYFGRSAASGADWASAQGAAALRIVGNLGKGAEALADERLRPVLASIFGEQHRPAGWSRPTLVRMVSFVVLWLVAIAAVLAALAFVAGFLAGLEQGFKSEDNPFGPPSVTLPGRG